MGGSDRAAATSGRTRLPEGPALNPVAAEIVSAALLVGVLAFAVVRPRDWPEAVAAGPSAFRPAQR